MTSKTRVLAPLAVAVLLAPMLSLQAQNTARPSNGASEFPRAELFLGYSRFGTGSTDTVPGNRMVGLNGGSASIAFNFNRYLGLVADFGGYDDSQLQLTGNGANEPLVVNASGTAYTYLFGPRLSYRNSTRFTPFAQVLAGGVHASDVTISGCSGPECTPLPAQNAFAMTAGGGLDIRLTRHFSIRAVQAEYMMTRFAEVPTGGSSSQNDLRLSSGLVYGFGGRPEPGVILACSIQPATAYPGDPLTVTATATNLNPKRKAVYSWETNGGSVSGTDATATIDTTHSAPGTYGVTGRISQGSKPTQQAICSASYIIQGFEPPTVTCAASPSTVNPGDSSTITAEGVSPHNRPLTYSYSTSAGTVTGNTTTATLNTTGVAPGEVTVTCSTVDDLGKSASANTIVTVSAPPPVAAPQTRDLCSVSFDRDHKRPERVDNEAKACLDDIALNLQRESTGHLVVVGNYSEDEQPASAAKRTLNVRQYLVNEKGIDPSRIDLRVGAKSGRNVTDVFVPAGATYNDTGTSPVDPSTDPQAGPKGNETH